MKMKPRPIKAGTARRINALLTAGGLASAICFTVAPAARAQDTATLPTQNVSISLSNAPVRTALDGLFKSTSLNYTIDPSINENVTVTLHDVPFEVALKSILRSSTPELRYSVSDGVYKIYAPAADSGTSPTTGNPTVPGYPGATSGAGNPNGGPNIGIGPGVNISSPASTDTKQLVLIHLIYAPGLLLNAVIGPVSVIAPQLYTPGASGGIGGSTGGVGGLNGSLGSSSGYGSTGTLGGTSSFNNGSIGSSSGFGSYR